MLGEAEYREEILAKVKDPLVMGFWKNEFGKWSPKQVAEAASPIQNKSRTISFGKSRAEYFGTNKIEY